MQHKKTINQNDLQLIERYFELDLTEAELKTVTNRLEQDEPFLQLFREYEKSHLLVEHIFDKDAAGDKTAFQENWQTAFEAHKEQAASKQGSGQVIPLRWKQWLATAAAVALLLGVFWFAGKDRLHADRQELAASYWEMTATESLEVVRGDAAKAGFDKQYEAAMLAFMQKDFARVKTLLEEIPADYPGINDVLILRGKTLTEQKNFGDAIAVFEKVLLVPEKGSNDLALWFQALTFLKAGEPDAARKNLERIVAKDYPLSAKASELLGKMD